ncbi:MAG: SurA N-terminal domain-containing protein [Thermodesulfobacteriota bacterium]
MDQKRCGRCGKELSGGDEVCCSDCNGDVRRKKKRRRWYAVAAAALLLLSGAAFLYAEKNDWEFSWDALLGRPAALVNGEPISRSEARARLNVSRLMLEKEYGKGLFAGEQGRALLGRLKRDVLEKMVDERLVAQEASRMKIRVGDDRGRQEMQRIGQEIYGNWENFQASLKEDGISQEYLMNHIRNLLLRQEVKKAKSPPKADPDAYFVAWLEQDRRSAKVTFNQTITPLQASAQGQRSCCGSGGGSGAGGCGGKQAGPPDPELESKASAAALTEFRKNNPAEKDVEAKVTDYGCHIQVDIEKGGRTIWSYSYQDGNVTDN